MRVEHLTTLDKGELKLYRTLRQPVEHFEQGFFVAEGEKVVRRLLSSTLETLSILCTPDWLTALAPEIEERDISVYVGTKDLLGTIVGYNLHQGIMAIGRVPVSPPLASYLLTKQKILLVALDGLVNAENVGVVVRNCAAFGVDGILVGETSSSPYLRRAVRNSMGTVFKLPIFHRDNLASTLQEMKAASIQSIAAHPHASSTLGRVNLNDKLCIVFGSEGSGIRTEILKACDEQVAIPMKQQIDSINVASASAVFLYEISRSKV